MHRRFGLILNSLISWTGFIIQRRVKPGFEAGIAIELETIEKEAIYKFRPYSMTSFERLSAIALSMRYLKNNNIEGALVECGVWAGGSIGLAAFLSQQKGEIRDVSLFDTFEGMTAPSEIDSVEAHEGYKNTLLVNGTSSWCAVNLSEVKSNLASTGIALDRFSFIAGDVSTTLMEESNIPTKIALLRLDTDWYKSTYDELTYLYPRLVKGGIIIIDDFGAWEGARSTVTQYFEENNIYPLMIPIDETGRIFIKE